MRLKDLEKSKLSTKIKKILIASGNKGKLIEIANLLQEIGIKAISAADFHLEDPEETGNSFEENSVLKAKYYGDKTGLISLADDSGLCIDLLNGEPGIHSARWAVNNKTGEKNFDLAFEKIKQKLILLGVDFENHVIKSHFICNLTLYDPGNGEIKSFEGRVDGKITFPPRGKNGFGYDPIFISDRFDHTFGEILAEEKDKISHRTKAFDKFITHFQLY